MELGHRWKWHRAAVGAVALLLAAAVLTGASGQLIVCESDEHDASFLHWFGDNNNMCQCIYSCEVSACIGDIGDCPWGPGR